MVRFVKPAHLTRWQWMVERFWKSVDKRGPDDCWPWLAAKVTDGYGTIAYAAGEPYATHRLAYVIEHGRIPAGQQVLHSCDNPACCNIRHLSLGTNADNVRDMISKRRGSIKLTKEQVLSIRADSRKHREIAVEYAISQSLVSLIKSGKRWSDDYMKALL